MQSLILAAGMGTRLGDLTKDKAKCMVSVNGVSLIERMLRQLDKLSLSRIVMVVGYLKDTLKDYISKLDIKTPIVFYSNPIYDKTNNIHSLNIVKSLLTEDDTLLLESDLIIKDGILESLIQDPRPNLALADNYNDWMDGTGITIDSDGNITSFVPGNKLDPDNMDQYFKTVNIYKLSKVFSAKWFVPFLDAYIATMGTNEYYERVFGVISFIDHTVLGAKLLYSQEWYEIDTPQDLEQAGKLFS